MIVSPLRYPGGKAKLFPFFARLVQQNGLFQSSYKEPYAGGAGLALRLLCTGHVREIHLNDVDTSIYAFWDGILNHRAEFCELIKSTPITMDEWHKQKDIWQRSDETKPISLGFATFFLNRTNRSGIIEGAGPIGGYKQAGVWKIDVRFPKERHIQNINLISNYREQITFSKLDALRFIENSFAERTFMYLDPPYYVKGHKLYKNFYKPSDHAAIASALKSRRDENWVVSYDDVAPIRTEYEGLKSLAYDLSYSAGSNQSGAEVIYISDNLNFPTEEVASLAMRPRAA